MVRAVAVLGSALVLAVGCGKELNPEFCATHPNDTDCRGADLVMFDAALGCKDLGCTDMKLPVCEESTNNCVQCIPAGFPGTDPMQCPVNQTCGPDRKCHTCLVDTDRKDTKVCLSSGDCAPIGTVWYAQPMPATQGDCSIANPCTFSEAIAKMVPGHNTVKLTTTFSGSEYTGAGVTIAKSGTIIGTGTNYTPTGPDPAITVSKATVEIVGITVTGSATDGIACDMGVLELRHAALNANTGYGVHTTKCDVTLERTKFTSNVAGGMHLVEGLFEVRNNFVGPDNGNSSLTMGNVWLEKATGRFVFNTVAKNKSEQGGGDRQSAIKCTGGPMVLVAHNIFASNGPANAEHGGDCTYFSNYEGNSVTGLGFASATDFHLTAASPAVNPVIVDDPDAEADCHVPIVSDTPPYIDDIDGQARPNNRCDRGADEYRP